MKITGLIFGTSGTSTKNMLTKDKLENTKTQFEKVPKLKMSSTSIHTLITLLT